MKKESISREFTQGLKRESLDQPLFREGIERGDRDRVDVQVMNESRTRERKRSK